ncbi:Phage-related protein, tail component [Pseudomonas koreensis]|uniref:tail assembly protein n=1 Tax=Pseudomonas koreensis TaxID=198620 RepID=UPI000879C26F|nr:tail assembly protein [Pseudomonas koreensis]KAB0515193.1 tail assembly protein [Pseudomonas koreensis]NNA60866.1 tail assembly protein [Pseudomonas koreensis]GGK24674.1 tail assembly protein [Pseudomonas koreensis]SDD99255.1 Phage-related protein, tail component [Pseudomonas koreensis]
MAMATNYGTKTRILLGGSAGKLFGREHIYELSTGDTREAVKAIDVNHPGFAKYLADAKRKGLEFAVFRNRKNIGERELKMGGAQEIRIVPVIAGSKRAGLFQTVLGVVLIAMSSVTNGATLAPGIALAAGGVIQMLSPQATGLKQSSSPENAPSYAFGSAKNTTASGNPVPICIGERRWGGIIISASIHAEDKA